MDVGQPCLGDIGFEFNKRKQKVRRFKEVLEALEEDVVSQGLWE